ncbi:MAG: LamG-like jellyroll fold domain-containing protein [Planctomycetota bacterium]
MLLSSAPTPIAQWRVDSDAATVVDSSANQYDGMLTGGAETWGVVGEALDLDGTDDRVEVTGVQSLDSSFTVSLWAKSDTATWNDHGTLASRRPQFILFPRQGTSDVWFYVLDTSSTWQIAKFSAPSGFDIQDWHHYAGTYDASTGDVKLYVDGQLATVQDSTGGGNITSDTGPIYFGKDDLTSQNRYLDGAIDDVQLFDSALSQSDIDNVIAESTDRSEDLEGHWKLDDGAGSTVADSSGNGLTGTLHGGTVTTGPDGVAGSAMQFDGVSDYVEITNAPNLQGSVSVSLWAKSDTATWNNHGFLASKRAQFMLFPRQGTQDVWMYARTDTATWKIAKFTAPGGFDIQQWHHYAGTYNSATGDVKLYVDGQLMATDDQIAQDDTVGALASDTGVLTIGRDDGQSRYFDGAISDVRLYDAELSATDVTDLHAAISPTTTTGGLQLDLPLDSITAGATADTSGFGRDGTVSGAVVGSGVVGNGLVFDGVDDHITVGSFPDLTNALTVALWAKSDGARWNVHGTLASRYHNFIMHPMVGTDNMRFYVRQNGGWEWIEFDGNNEPGFDAADWHHYAGVYDPSSGGVRLYVDGVEKVVDATVSGSLDAGSGDILIGRQAGQNRYLDGSIDEVHIYDDALDVTEIASLATIAPVSVSWDAGGDGIHWGDALNWSNDEVPGTNSDVVIDVSGTPTIIIEQGDASAKSILTEEQIEVRDRQLTVVDSVQGGGSVQLGHGAHLIGGDWHVDVLADYGQNSDNLLRGITLSGDLMLGDGTAVWVENGLTVDGSVTVGGVGSASTGTRLQFRDTQSLDGTGEVVLVDYDSEIGIYEFLAPATLSIGPNLTIRGRGEFYDSGQGTIVNQGTIRSDSTEPSAKIRIRPDSFENQGLLEATQATLWIDANSWTNAITGTIRTSGGDVDLDGAWTGTGSIEISSGILELGGSFDTPSLDQLTRTGGEVRLNGTLNNVGHTLLLDATTGDLRFYRDAEIIGGEVATADGATLLADYGINSYTLLDGVTLSGEMVTSDGMSIWVENGLVVDGSLTIGGLGPSVTAGSRLNFRDTQTLSGTGQVILARSDAELVAYESLAPATLTIGPDLTIRGRGELDESGLGSIVNQGTIRSDSTESSAKIRIRPDSFENQGLLEAAEGTLWINADSYVNAGQTIVRTGAEYEEGVVKLDASIRPISGSEVLFDQTDFTAIGASNVNLNWANGPSGGATFESIGNGNVLIAQDLPVNTQVELSFSASQGTGTIQVEIEPSQTPDTPLSNGLRRIADIQDSSGNSVPEALLINRGFVSSGSAQSAANLILGGLAFQGATIPEGFVPEVSEDGSANIIVWRSFDILSGWSGWSVVESRDDIPHFYGTYTAADIKDFLIVFEELISGLAGWGTSLLGSEDPNAQGDMPIDDNFTADPIRFHDGTILYQTTDLESAGYGDPFGHRRSWTNRSQFVSSERSGSGFVLSEIPSLSRLNGGETIHVVGSGTDVRTFQKDANDDYQSTSFLPNTLEASAGEFTFTTTAGDRYVFFDFDPAIDTKKRGQFKESFDSAGNRTFVHAWTTDGDIQEIRREDIAGVDGESWLYGYKPGSDENAGKIDSVQLRRFDGANWQVVRQAEYDYYDSADDYGNVGDLKTATIKEPGGDVIDTKYYRYYEYGEVGGYAHGLKMVLHGESFARLDAAVANPFAASDAQIKPYANHYFEYDEFRRATRHDIQGMGGDASDGVGTHTYDYYSRLMAATGGSGVASIGDHNAWVSRTTETLPTGNQNVVYSNAAGNVMLKVFKNLQDDANPALENGEWLTYYRYDADGRVIWKAESPAVTGYDEAHADLLNESGGSFQYLADADGIVYVTEYYDATTATESVAGAVDGYVNTRKIKHGELGTEVKLSEQDYYERTAGVASIAPQASSTVYRNDDGTGAQTTLQSYTWFSGTVQPETVTTTLPAVTTAQNGSGVANSVTAVFDADGRLIWQQDADGFLHYTEYDHETGAITKSIVDVDTTQTSDFTDLPTGLATPTGGGLHLVNTYEVDGLGRVTKATDPNGNIDYTVYRDAEHEIRSYAGWDTSLNRPTGPTTVIRSDRPGSYVETITMSAAPSLNGGRPDGGEALGSLESLSRILKNNAGQVSEDRAYHDLAGLTYSTSLGFGTEGDDYYVSEFAYDAHAKQNRAINPNGTITVTLRDGLGRVRDVYVGTDDSTTDGDPWTPANAAVASNMTLVSRATYDDNTVGDGDLTRTVAYTASGAAAPRISDYRYDWRNRLVASKSGVAVGGTGSESNGVQRPLTLTTYDNLNQAIETLVYDGDGVAVTATPASSLLRAKSTAAYDELGRVYRSNTFAVDPANGTVSANTLGTDVWYDARGQVVKTAAPGGVVTKSDYDGAGRLIATYTGDGGGDATYADAFDQAGDLVLEQVETTYDDASNPILVTARQRFHDATGTGDLGTPTSTPEPKARVSYAASYYDQADRKTADVSVGTNGGTTYTRPTTVPTRSDDVLVSSYTYTPAGYLYESTDPTGTVTRFAYDDLGRTVTQIESYVDGTPSDTDDRITRYAYDGNGNLTTLTADLPTGEADQITEYVYGVSQAPGSGGSEIDSNDLLAAVKYPDRTSGAASTSQQETYTYNAAGQVLTRTDLNGNVHTYSYDDLGRVTSDAATTLGTGVDGSVRRLDTAYDSAGRAYLFTSYDNATPGSGNVVNQVQREFNGLGQLVREYQAHGGTVNVSTTPSVQYGYSEMANTSGGGANHSRLTSLTYPNGRTLTFNYDATANGGIDNAVSRLTSITDSATSGGGGLLATYAYLGGGKTIERELAEPGLALTYLKQGSEPNGNAGDPYVGLDRFGRLADQRWLDVSASNNLARVEYTHNRLGQRTSRNDPVATANSVAQDELYTYDALYRLTAIERGELNPAADAIQTGTDTFSQDWSLNALGSWDQLTQDDDGDGTADLSQTRTHNAANEVTGISGGGWTTPAHDDAGNLTTLPVPGNPTAGYTAIYDAWNRLVELQDSGTSQTRFTYTYDARGRRLTEATYTAGSLTETRGFYHDAGSVVEETVTPASGGGGIETVDRQYVWSPEYVDALLLQDRDSDGNGSLDERRYALADESFSVVALTDESGAVVERFRYDPYGQRTVLDADFTDDADDASDADMTIGFQGLREDASGLHHQRARYWHADLGRFISRDPAGYPDGMSRYAGYHVMGGLVDPSGLDATPGDDVMLSSDSDLELNHTVNSIWNSPHLPSHLKHQVRGIYLLNSLSSDDRLHLINRHVLPGYTGAVNAANNRAVAAGEQEARDAVWYRRSARVAQGYFVDAPVSAVTGTYQAVTNPVETVQGVGHAVMNPTQTYQAFKAEVQEALSTDRGRGQIVGSIVQSVGGAAGAARVAHVAKLKHIRSSYVREVEGLADLGYSARAAGSTGEATARLLNAERNALKVKYRAKTPASLVKEMEARNLRKYGDPLGPSIDYFRSKGRSWESIIDSASKPAKGDLGL